MGFLVALQFLTVLPAPRREITAAGFGQSLTYFPLVGLILGVILLVLNFALTIILPPPVVNALLIIALVVLTGAHHLDGLIDTFMNDELDDLLNHLCRFGISVAGFDVERVERVVA